MRKAKSEHLPLFETKSGKGLIPFRLFVASTLASICFIFVYRVRFMPAVPLLGNNELEADLGVRWTAWIGLFLAEIWFSFHWLLVVALKWKRIYRTTHKQRLSLRYDEAAFPGIDIIVCTADAKIEPPIMVVNTILSVMAYDYPSDKLSVYLSDDGGSDLMFYAMLEASRFSEQWIPFCRKFKVEPRSPEAFFDRASEPIDDHHSSMANQYWTSIKKLYEEMKARIESPTKLGRISEEIHKQHKGFREWNFVSSRSDHQTILQIIIDGRDAKALDTEGQPLPTLVYLAREKRPQYNHNFKAGSMNAAIRVSSRISNAPIILNVDCDMYSNNSESARDAICFFLDEDKGHEIGFVQFPQAFENLTDNDIYSTSMRLVTEVELPGVDSNGGPCYIGTGCFHRRESLCGKKYSSNACQGEDWTSKNDVKIEEESVDEVEETCKVVASCTYEENTEWGKEMGVKYGCAVEDVITGFAIQCRGWKSVFIKPERAGFVGLAPTKLLQSLIQQERWLGGQVQFFFSKYCPILYGYKKVSFGLQLCYCHYALGAPNSLALLYFVAVPSLCLLKGISLFPKLSNPWVIPFVYVFFGNLIYSLVERLCCGGTCLEWLNAQRNWLFGRITSYLFAILDNILRVFGITKWSFIVTSKVADEDASERYKQELMEFGATSPMFTILATIALLNAFVLVWAVKRFILEEQSLVIDSFALQIILCGLLVFINLPVYQALFLRKDKGRMPSSITYPSIAYALAPCFIALYY
ncbi:hypothetical protein FNV43_RR10032 [Rhamnella rubrinervis]|uniref:Cellulose synthase-like protein E6 n=1 Tax=Rhamnella rubrinervis TaxID=2594499 RepID=A0A8K0HBU6_9ROSA|nr:hypothetical protein FNV43_RR10032 [Rhamnella rubrinervis]